MNLADKIVNVEAELTDLRQQLKDLRQLKSQSRLTVKKELVIQQGINETVKLLTELYRRSAPTGQSYPVHSTHRIPTNSMRKKDNNSYHLLDTSSVLSIVLTSLILSTINLFHFIRQVSLKL